MKKIKADTQRKSFAELYSDVAKCIPPGAYFISDIWNNVGYDGAVNNGEEVEEFALELEEMIDELKETLNNLEKANLV